MNWYQGKLHQKVDHRLADLLTKELGLYQVHYLWSA